MSLLPDEVPVRQPPKLPVPRSQTRARREKAQWERKFHKAKKREYRKNIRELNRKIKAHKFGARLSRERIQGIRQEVRELRAAGKAQRKQHQIFVRHMRQHERLAKLQSSRFKRDARASKKAMRELKRAHSTPGRSMSAQARAHSSRGKKAANLLHMFRLVQKAVASSRPKSGRNHGFKGVMKRNKTGLAGR